MEVKRETLRMGIPIADFGQLELLLRYCIDGTIPPHLLARIENETDARDYLIARSQYPGGELEWLGREIESVKKAFNEYDASYCFSEGPGYLKEKFASVYQQNNGVRGFVFGNYSVFDAAEEKAAELLEVERGRIEDITITFDVDAHRRFKIDWEKILSSLSPMIELDIPHLNAHGIACACVSQMQKGGLTEGFLLKQDPNYWLSVKFKNTSHSSDRNCFEWKANEGASIGYAEKLPDNAKPGSYQPKVVLKLQGPRHGRSRFSDSSVIETKACTFVDETAGKILTALQQS